MAGFLSQLPNLLGAAKGSGILDSLKGAVGNILSDVGSGKVASWGDFGRSLARSGAKLLGVDSSPPVQDNHTTEADNLNKKITENSNNAANLTTMIQPGLDKQPKGHTYIPFTSDRIQEPRREAIMPTSLMEPTELEILHEIKKAEKKAKAKRVKKSKKKAKRGKFIY